MPNLKTLSKRCKLRYGYSFGEPHRWMDEPVKLYGPSHRKERHDRGTTLNKAKQIFENKVPEPYRKFIRDACLDHIIADEEGGELPRHPRKRGRYREETRTCPIQEVRGRELTGETKEKLKAFFSKRAMLKKIRKTAARNRKSLTVNFDRLLEFDMDLAEHLLISPDEFLCTANNILEDITKIPGFHLNVKNWGKTLVADKVRAEELLGRFIQVRGTLTRISTPRVGVRMAVFKCIRCGEETTVPQTGGILRHPLACELREQLE